VNKKIVGCVHQIGIRNVEQLATGAEIMAIESMAKVLIARIDEKLAGGNDNSMATKAYIAVPVSTPVTLPRSGFYSVRHTHITITAPTANIQPHIHQLGNAVHYNMSPILALDNTFTHHAHICGHSTDGEINHVTRFVRDGFMPFEAATGFKKIAKIGPDGLIPGTTYEFRTGFQVLM
jgi:hypothetical protein